jgi:hypothetical protein
MFGVNVNLCIVAVLVVAAGFYANALESQPYFLPSAEYASWSASNHIRVVTNANHTSHLVEFTILVDKPERQDVFWDLTLQVFQGTNASFQAKLGDVLWPPEFTAGAMGIKRRAYFQRISFAIVPEWISNSTIEFTQRRRPVSPSDIGVLFTPHVVRLIDMFDHASATFSTKTKPEH